MKKLFTVVVAAVLCAACSSNKSNVKNSQNTAAASKAAKYQIIDQEFDNLLAPEADYDTLPAYELQACGDSYLPPAEVKLKGAAKPAKKAVKKTAAKKTEEPASDANVTKNKKVINTTNIYYLDGSGTDSSTTTTQTTSYSSNEVLPGDLPDTL